MNKLLILALCALTLTGCVTVPSTEPTVVNKERAAWLTFSDTWAATKFVYDRYCERAVQGKVSTADQQVIDAAWNSFRALFRAKLLEASQNWAATAPESVRFAGNNVIVLAKSTE